MKRDCKTSSPTNLCPILTACTRSLSQKLKTQQASSCLAGSNRSGWSSRPLLLCELMSCVDKSHHDEQSCSLLQASRGPWSSLAQRAPRMLSSEGQSLFFLGALWPHLVTFAEFWLGRVVEGPSCEPRGERCSLWAGKDLQGKRRRRKPGGGKKRTSGGRNVWSWGVWALGVSNREPQKVLKEASSLVYVQCSVEGLSDSNAEDR